MRSLLLALVFLSLASPAHAQWTPVSAPTTENLWGVCYGANQFVAVGTAGTILTSSTGAAWTARASSTTEWLTAVCYASDQNRYIAVGDHGTILTSPDALVWTPRPSGTTKRLNGIGYGGGRFVAVGEQGAVARSNDGASWQLGDSGASVFLRGVIFVRDRFVVSGAAGTLLTTTDGRQFARLGIVTHDNIEALAWNGSTCFAVGGFGAIAQSSDLKNWIFHSGATSYLRGILSIADRTIVVGSPQGSSTLWDYGFSGFWGSNFGASSPLNAIAAGPPALVAVGASGAIQVQLIATVKPESLQITPLSSANFVDSYAGAGANLYAGETVILAATGTALAALPLHYQWSHNSLPLPGATEATLTLADLRKSDAGSYDVTVSNDLGTVTNTPASSFSVVVQLPPRALGSRDPGFVSPVTAPPWTVAVQPDGRIVVAAPMFFYPQDVPQYGLARLHPDGSLDDTFRVPSGGIEFGDSINAIDVLPDGRIAVHGNISSLAGSHGPFFSPTLNADGSLDRADNSPFLSGNPSVLLSDGRRIDFLIENNTVTLARRLADGTPDPAYPGFSFSLTSSNWPWGGVVTARDAAGGILVATSSSPSGPPGGNNQARLFRLLADGELDSSFPLAPINDVITKMIPIAGKIYYQSKWLVPFWYGDFRQKFGRLHADGSADPAYQPIELSASRTSNWPPADLCADGSVVAGWFGGLARLTAINSAYATPLVNLSIRTTAGSGDQTLIAGFVVAGGDGSRTVLARGIGPGLTSLGIGAPEILSNPRLTLYHEGSAVATNDDWDATLTDSFSALGAFPLVSGSKDSALLSALAPGAYTAHVTSSAGGGLALVELYDADPAPTSASSPRLVNLSGRAHVGTGDNVLIAGFVIAGNSTKRVLVRAVGPGLLAQGVSDALADPELSVHHAGEIVDENDSWDSTDADTFKSVGAFALSPGSADAALVLALSPGVYTAVVKGVNATTGTALVEIYEVP